MALEMDRRDFIIFAWSALLVSPKRVRAEHHVVSADPLIVDSDLRSLPSRYTPAEDFYIRNHHDTPQDSGRLCLQIEGEVERPQKLAPDHLAHLGQRELGAVLECAGNPVAAVGLISCGIWEGWPLGDVLSLARPNQGLAYLHLFGRDGYTRSVCGDRTHGAMLATSLNGRPLQRNHGGPWRALFPGWYGMDSVKWLERIVVSKTALPANGNSYLEVRTGASGHLDQQSLPRMQVKSVILAPANNSVVRRGRMPIRGLAWSGEGRIAGVEVSADGGTRWSATALEPGTLFEWTLWQASLELSRPGIVELACRATDERGNMQPAERDPKRVDDYASNWYHRVRCVVV